MLPKKTYGNHFQMRTKFPFRVLCLISAVIICLSLFVLPVSAETDVTMYEVYDTDNNNNVIAYYTVRALPSNPPSYDIDQVYLVSTNGVLTDATNLYISSYTNSNDITLAQDDVYRYLTNHIGLESNPYNGTGLNSWVNSWLLGYLSAQFLCYQNSLVNLYQLNASYASTIANARQQSYDAGYNDGLNDINNQAFNAGYDNGYNAGHSAGYSEGQSASNENAYLTGYSDGTDASNGSMKFIYAFFSAPFVFMSNLFHFQLFGIDVYNIILTLLTMILVYWVVKFIISHVQG